MAVTKRYAVYCHGELIGEYTAVDAADMLKCTPGTVRTYASYGKATIWRVYLRGDRAGNADGKAMACK